MISFSGYMYDSGSGFTSRNGGVIFLGNAVENTSIKVANIALSPTGDLIASTLDLVSNVNLSGTGTIQGSLVNAARVLPGNGAGKIDVQGDYRQDENSSLIIEIGGVSAGTTFDQLVVAGDTELGGKLEINTINGFQPTIGQEFQIFDADNISGAFTNITGNAVGGNVKLQPQTRADGVYLVAVQDFGPKVIGTAPETSARHSFGIIDVSFDEPIKADSLAVADLVLTGPGGPITIDMVSLPTPTTARFAFADQTEPGDYTFTVGPGISDLADNLMDQDGNGTGGEATDRYQATITLTVPDEPVVFTQTPSGKVTTSLTEIQLGFSVPLDLTTARNSDNYTLIHLGADQRPGGGDDQEFALTPAYTEAALDVALTPDAFTTGLPDGYYQLKIHSGPTGIQNVVGGQLDGNDDGTPGDDYVGNFEVSTSAASVSVTLAAKSDSGISSSDGITNIATPTFEVTVNQIGTIGFDFDRNGVPEQSVFASQPGIYSFTHSINNDGSHSPQVIFHPAYGNRLIRSTSLILDRVAPTLPDGSTTEQAPLLQRAVTFSEAVTNSDGSTEPGSLEFSLSAPAGQSVVLREVTGNAESYKVSFDPLFVSGDYQLLGSTNIFDLAGNQIAAAPVDAFSLLADMTKPVVTAFTPLGETSQDVAQVRVQFSEPMDLATLTDERVTVSSPEGVPAISAVSINPVDGSDVAYDIALSTPISQPGDYLISLAGTVADLSGNTLGGSYSAAITIDKTGPQVTAAIPGDIQHRLVDSIEVTFDSPIDATTFRSNDVVLMGPSGQIGTAHPVSLGGKKFRITFPPQRANGTYEVTIGPNVTDLAGNSMDQNGNGTTGETGVDSFTHTFAIGLPNLIVGDPIATLDLQDSPVSNVQIGSKFRVSWVTQNVGAFVASGEASDRVWLSADSNLDSGDQLLGSFALSGGNQIHPDGRYSGLLTTSIPLTSDSVAGDFYILVQTDSVGRVTESNEQDNVRAVPIRLTLPPLPDLVASEIVLPSSVTPGQSFDLTWKVDNIGDDVAKGPWIERVYLSNHADGQNRQLIASFPRSGDLTPTANAIVRTESISLPRQTLNGDVHFMIEVDSGDAVFESDESNLFASQNTLNIPASLKLDFSASEIAEDGSHIRGTITRNGDVSLPLTVSLDVSVADQLSLPSTVTIPAGQYATRFSVAAIDESVIDADVLVAIQATADGYPSSSDSLTVINNDFPTLDFVFSATTLAEGDEVTATITRGAVATEDVIIRLASSDLAQLNGPATVTLPAGQSSVEVTYTAVDDLLIELQTTHQVSVSANGHTGDAESVMIEESDIPALTIEMPSTLSEGSIGPSVIGRVYRETVSSTAVVVQLEASHPDQISLPEFVTIPAGQSYGQFVFAISDDAVVSGDRTINVTAQALPTSGQSPIESTLVSKSISILEDDGAVLAVSFDQLSVSEGRKTWMTVNRNTEDLSSEVTVNVQVDDDSELVITSPIVIPAGQESVRVEVSGIRDGVIDGDKVVTATALADGFLSGTGTIVVADGTLPDLEVVALSPSKSIATTNETIDVSWTIRNTGFAPANGIWTQRVFISDDATIGNDVLAGQYTYTGPLGKGQSYDRTVPVRLPSRSGQYWIVVQTDSTQLITEGLETNNAAIIASAIDVQSAYTATVSTEVETAPADTPVLLTGTATNTDQTPAAFKQVSVHLSVRGTKRVFPAITDAAGNFSLTFNPLPGEGGQYTVGAAHPGDDTAVVQDTFQLVGMRVEPPADAISVKEGAAATSSSITLRNLADVRLTGLSVEVVDAAANLQVTAVAAGNATSIDDLGTLELTYSVSASDSSVRNSQFQLRISSNEAPDVVVPIDVRVVPLVSRLVANTNRLSTSMLVGDQTVVEFTVTNSGGKSSGELEILLPGGADWLKLATGNTLPELGPGESVPITLLLTPPTNLALTAYNGSLIVRGADSQLEMPFSFRAVSENTGDLQVTITDEYFYFTEDKPLVTDATVRLLDPFTGLLIASSEQVASTSSGSSVSIPEGEATVTIDGDGRVSFFGIPEGPYSLEVVSENHESYRNNIRIDAGELNAQQIFVSRNLVEYTWTVEEIEVEDRTRITIDAEFETNVPAPVVVVEGQLDLGDLTEVGQSQQFIFKIRNEGLIAAEDVAFEFGEHPYYQITPLIDIIGILPAKSEVIVPVIVVRTSSSDDTGEGGTGGSDGNGSGGSGENGSGSGGSGSGGGSDGSDVGTSTQGDVPCDIPARVTYQYDCDERVFKRAPIAVVNVDSDCPVVVYQPSSGSRSNDPTRSGPSRVQSSPVIVKDGCQVAPCFEELVSTMLCGLPGGSCLISTAAGAAAQGTIRIQSGGSLSGEDLGDHVGGFLLCFLTNGNIPICLIYNGTKLVACLDPTFSFLNDFSSFLRQARSASVHDSAILIHAGADVSQVDIPYGGELGEAIRSFLESYQATLRMLEPYAYMYGSDYWFKNENTTPVIKNYHQSTTKESEEGLRISANEMQAILATSNQSGLSTEETQRLVDRWNRSVSYWAKGVYTVQQLSPTENADFVDLDLWRAKWNAAAAAETEIVIQGHRSISDAVSTAMVDLRIEADRYEAEGVCATVGIQISQDAVLTRSIFEARLGVSNQSETDPIKSLSVDIDVTSLDGTNQNDLFEIQLVSQQGISLDGQINAGQLGELVWQITPSDQAANSSTTTYLVSGQMSYSIGAEQYSIDLAPASISVVPQAELTLNYFLQRDVISDDPHTAEVESAEPFTLAVQVQNNGGGAARNLRIESAQPRIVENEKGLLIDFEITGTRVNGEEKRRSLTAEFGDVGPGELAIAEWEMESTLQGLFVDYNATFEHVSGLGDNRFSLIKEVQIHELIHVANAAQVDGDDGLSDFLVNDLPDPSDLPDTLYLSDGSVMEVGLGAATAVDAPPVIDDLRVAVTAEMVDGWSYLKMDDPGNGQFSLLSVLRSDGTELPLENFWQTDRTFVGGGLRPVLEDKIHLLDHNSTGSYTFVFSNGDLVGPQLEGFSGVDPNPTTQTINFIEVQFDETLDLASFDASDVTLTKNGVAIDLANVTISSQGNDTYRIAGLGGVTDDDAVYELSVNLAGLTDQVGNAGMGTESFRWVKGETAPAILGLSGVPSGLTNDIANTIDVEFSKTIDASSFSAADLSLTRDGVEVADNEITVAQLGERTFRIGNLSRLTSADADYRLTINAEGVQDAAGLQGVGSAIAQWTLDSTAPVLIQVVQPPTNPRNIVVQQIDLLFSEPIDVSSLDVDDLSLVRSGSHENLIAGDARVSFEDRGNNLIRVRGLNWVQAFVSDPQVADFTLSVVAAGIMDPAGNAGIGTTSATWTVDLDKPLAATNLELRTLTGPVVNGQVNARKATVTGTLAEPGLSISIRSTTNDTELARKTITGTTFEIPIEFPSSGSQRLQVRVVDPAGNVADTFIEDLFVRDIAPSIDSIDGLPGQFTNQPLGDLTIRFVDPIVAGSLTTASLSLKRNGGVELIGAQVAITPDSDSKVFTIDGLGGLTELEGRYDLLLTLDGITNASGLTSTGTLAFDWITDLTSPSSAVSALSTTQALPSFVIGVTGSDPEIAVDVDGAGISAYDLYVSVAGAPFEYFETLPFSAASTTFVGEENTEYRFYSVARDAAGNVEPPPSAPDTQTTISRLGPAVDALGVQGVLTARSFVDRIEIEFEGQTNLDDLIADSLMSSAFTLTHLGMNANTDEAKSIEISESQFRYQYDLTMDRGLLIWSLDSFASSTSSLEDGIYVVELDSSLITDVAGFPLDGDGDGTGGGTYRYEFHRLAGDADGNGFVGPTDMAVVLGALGATPSSSKWNENMDLDRDGRITVRDRVLVARALNRGITPAGSASIPSDRLTPFDVTVDGEISPLDALAVINQIARSESGVMSDRESTIDRTGVYDVNRDGQVSPVDALFVINQLARMSAADNDSNLGSAAANDHREATAMFDLLRTLPSTEQVGDDLEDEILTILANDSATQ
ncbi:Ig-like domain-containing protein [Roseiconus lacunae]|uniref:Ig-like domain-containing protein n=1 Tax=Roseiconus lacunae TaxID=2605694 RepID=A0ABT7PQH7_9BACT|nr:Ig-like domain-containing protein [Roseiconus lacunae]MDM4018763.1 Ig-like domain-containing protein [Roseiconus lacunae]